MKNKWLIIFFFALIAHTGFSQDNELQVQGISPNIYLLHTVQAKETWYSVGRLYNISPKQLAPYNALTMEKALAIGQLIKVPLVAENFSQNGSKAADEVFVPVHHTLQEKEWLYRVSVNYNKVPIETLEKWNGVNKDQAKAGISLVVGYLKVKKAQSALAAQGTNKIIPASPVAINTTEEKKPVVKEEKKPAASPVVDNADVAKNSTGNTVKPEIKPVATTPVVTSTPASNPVFTSNTSTAKISYFKTQYEESGKSISGNAGIFKSTSGWSDGKFYALVNNVAVGTIIRINNPVTGKAVFAKVLGNLPDMKESLGLVARLSDAAAAELDAAGGKFSVELRY